MWEEFCNVYSPKAEKSKEESEKQKALKELVEWLHGEKYSIDHNSDTMTEEFEKEHLYEISRNRMIDKTINKILDMAFDS